MIKHEDLALLNNGATRKMYAGVTTATIPKLSRFVEQLQGRVEHKQNLPIALVNPTVVLQLLSTGVDTIEGIQKSNVEGLLLPIRIENGVANIYGSPVWLQMYEEPKECCDLLQSYLEMASGMKTRNIVELAKNNGRTVLELEQLKRTWHWNFRASQFDINKKSNRDLMLIEQQYNVLDSQRGQAGDILAKCMVYFENNFESIPPKDVIKMFELASQLQLKTTGLILDKSGIKGAEGMPSALTPTVNVNVNNGTVSSNEGAVIEVKDAPLQASKEDIINRVAGILNVNQSIGIYDDVKVEEVDAIDG